MFQILVVEDDAQFNNNICSCLTRGGYRAVGCHDGLEAFDRLGETVFDLIISDIMMPNLDGFAFARAVREQDELIPILFLTARSDISAKSEGFRIGVDDYLVKPVDMEELLLRVGALLRRANIVRSKQLVVGELTLNADEMSATLHGEDIPLTVREFQILYKLLSYPKKIFTRAQLMDEFWGMDSEVSSRSVDVFITHLRAKFEDCDSFEIITIRGLGYKAVLK